jgi:hypothetical protein
MLKVQNLFLDTPIGNRHYETTEKYVAEDSDATKPQKK